MNKIDWTLLQWMGTVWSWSDFQRVLGDVEEGGGQVRCGGGGYGGG